MVTRRQLLVGSTAALAACGERAAGPRTARDMVSHYLGRIEQWDRLIHSVIEINPEAMAIADQLDQERRAGRVRGPLHGVPILIKDNIDTADRMMTTAGSLALVGAPAPRHDAPLVKRLRDAGAVILGKTNLSEWANIRSHRSTSGWSGRGGQTRNPHALDRNPSGSSSGSGAAVAAELCAMAVGTETDGSIVSPSSINGIVGIKPTLGLVSGSGIIPIAHSQDTAGPMARTVSDAALLLSAMNERGLDFGGSLKEGALRGVKLGVARRSFGRNPGVTRVIESALQVLKKGGAELVDPVELPDDSQYSEAEFDVMMYELKHDLNLYLGARGGNVKSLADVIAFNDREAAREMPHFGQENLIQSQAKGPLTDKAYLDALDKSKRTAAGGIDGVIDKAGLTAIVAPTDGLAWLTDYVNGDHFTQGCSTPAAVAGYPHITVPAGFHAGLPVGLSFFGKANTEARLIGLAYDFERLSNARRAPRFASHAG